MEPEYRSRILTYIRQQAQPPDKFSHQARLYRLATELPAGAPFDDDVLFAAAWLHDLGVFIGHRPKDLAALAHWDHIAYVVEKAPVLLHHFGFPSSKIPAVLEAIRTHMPSGRPTAFEGVLLRDADILEQLGGHSANRQQSRPGHPVHSVQRCPPRLESEP
jgi:uncharacterized protein